VLDEPLDELAAAPVGVEAQDEEVGEAPAVRILRLAGRNGAVAIDQQRCVGGLP
jgi:hypothetical protein